MVVVAAEPSRRRLHGGVDMAKSPPRALKWACEEDRLSTQLQTILSKTRWRGPEVDAEVNVDANVAAIVISLMTLSFIYHFNLYPVVTRTVAGDVESWARVMRASARLVAMLTTQRLGSGGRVPSFSSPRAMFCAAAAGMGSTATFQAPGMVRVSGT